MNEPVPLEATASENGQTYDRLYVSLLDGLGMLQILLAVCDNDRLRHDTIARYERELEAEARCLRLTLDPLEPSLLHGLQTLLPQIDRSAIVTVMGAERLDDAAVEKFLGYLQWTREGLRAFAVPVVLWVPQRFLTDMAKRAPDFWSWRNGVFVFEAPVSDRPMQTPPEPELSAETSILFTAEQLETSLAKGLTQWGENSPILALLYAQLGVVYVARLQEGKCTDRDREAKRAEELLLKAIAFDPERSEDLAANLNNLAWLYYLQGRYKEAEPLLRQALQLRQELLGEHHPDVVTSLNSLARLYKAQGRYHEAEPLLRQTLQLRQEQFGEPHLKVATSFNDLAGLYRAQGRYEEAEPLYRQALQLQRELLGERHPDVATSLNNLALLYESQGRYEEAEPLLHQALQLQQELLGETHPDVATSLNNLAMLFDSQGRYEEAEPLYCKALQLEQVLLGDRHPDVAGSLLNLAVLYHNTKRHAEASDCVKQAVAIYTQTLGTEHPDSQNALSWLKAIDGDKNFGANVSNLLRGVKNLVFESLKAIKRGFNPHH